MPLCDKLRSSAALCLLLVLSSLKCLPLSAAPDLDLSKIPGATPRNIIVILTDDHRYDALGFLGHPFVETPNMDRLAEDGAFFENAFVTTSLCSPSRASILTGLYAHNHGVIDNYNPLPDNLVFFPQYLQAAGYNTAFIGKWHMGGMIDHPQPGFDHWVSFKGQGVYFPEGMKHKAKGRYVPQVSDEGFNVNGKRVPQTDYITDELTEYALDWLNSRPDDDTEPFLLYLSHKAVHADFLPHDRHAYKYAEEPFVQPLIPGDHPDEFTDVPVWVRNQRNSRHGVEFAYYENLNLAEYYRRYHETLLAVDESLGLILDWLQENNQLDDTAILYLGDNGFLFGEHGLIDKRCAYEASMRIPMIMQSPGQVPAGTVVDQIVANIDVAPTLLQIAGLEPPAHMDGASFLTLAEGKPDPNWRDGLLYEYLWERNYPQTPTTHAVRTDQYKYIRYHGVWDTDELYDLHADPDETQNLINSPDHQEIATRLNQQLFDLLESSHGDSIPLQRDRGTKFLHRKKDGATASEFPDWFYRDPDSANPGK
ncbi:MAG: sulfatase [Verrucomicrobiota bacterium]